jgi:branched-subunit amino acid ABC-type transport system permease component
MRCFHLALVLVFAVTRVIFIPQGEFVAFGALTLASFQAGKVPGTLWLLIGAGVAVAVVDLKAVAGEVAPGTPDFQHHRPARRSGCSAPA